MVCHVVIVPKPRGLGLCFRCSSPSFKGLTSAHSGGNQARHENSDIHEGGCLHPKPIGVNLRKDSFVVAQFIAPLTFEEKRRYELRDYER